MSDSRPSPPRADTNAQRRRFVVLKHDHPNLHWDLLIEFGDVLHSWRLCECPAAGRRISATRMPDHRYEYLDYEGPVSGNRGYVQRVHCGILEDDGAVGCYRLPDSAFAQRCREEVTDGESCWWVFE